MNFWRPLGQPKELLERTLTHTTFHRIRLFSKFLFSKWYFAPRKHNPILSKVLERRMQHSAVFQQCSCKFWRNPFFFLNDVVTENGSLNFHRRKYPWSRGTGNVLHDCLLTKINWLVALRTIRHPEQPELNTQLNCVAYSHRLYVRARVIWLLFHSRMINMGVKLLLLLCPNETRLDVKVFSLGFGSFRISLSRTESESQNFHRQSNRLVA